MKQPSISKTLFLITILMAPATIFADTIGSNPVFTGNSDGDAGEAYVYAGGYFSADQQVSSMTWNNGSNSPSDVLTPLMFQDNGSGDYELIGIGQTLGAGSGLQTASITASLGTFDTGASTTDTFGFITAALDGEGNITSATPGAVDFSGLQGGYGVSGSPSTNEWLYTVDVRPSSALFIGEVFSYTDGGYSCGSDVCLNYYAYGARTYSAEASSVPSSPEPTTWLLFATGLAGLALLKLRHRHQ